MNNPLLEFNELPPFSRIKPEHIEAALDTLLEKNRDTLKTLLRQQHFSWENFMQALEDMDVHLENMWSVVSHLNHVNNTAEIRTAYNRCLPKLTAYSTELAQNPRIYAAVQSIKDSAEFPRLSRAQQKVIENTLRDFRLSGATLPEAQKQRYREIQHQLASLTTKFEENLLDATDAWSKSLSDANPLKGIPEHALNRFREAAAEKNLPGWLINLEFPSYYAVMTYADDRDLRREMYTAYHTRASDQGPHAGRFDNSEIMEEILKLRHEEAQLIGYKHYADYSLATKMARDPRQVLGFLQDLAKRSKPAAQQEWETLKAFAQTHFALEEVQAWDVAYLSEKLRQHHYDFSEEALRPYFPENQVLQGLFTIAEKLFGIRIQERTDQVDTWHASVRYFEILDASHQCIAGFYIDLYARAKKRGGAWMDDCKNRHRFQSGAEQLPIAYLTCNFTRPAKHQPALLSHDEVLTLFHEFGHGLQHMLTQINIASVSGINGVAWDAVEFPSQLMEHFCWHKAALQLIARHHASGEPLPEDLYARLIASKNFHSALQMLRQLEFSLFDFRLHLEYRPGQHGQIQRILDEVRQEICVIPVPEFNRFQHGFSHIFAGGYAAGYYSYKWAEVLACDAFSQFEAHGVFDAATGGKFRDTILAQGGSQEPMDLFIAFQGREPEISALLRYNGIHSNSLR